MIDIECRRRWMNFKAPNWRWKGEGNNRKCLEQLTSELARMIGAVGWASRGSQRQTKMLNATALARSIPSALHSARVTKQNWPRPPPSSRMETIIMARQEEIPTANLHKNIIRPWNKKKSSISSWECLITFTHSRRTGSWERFPNYLP